MDDYRDDLVLQGQSFYTTTSGASGYDAAGRLMTRRVSHSPSGINGWTATFNYTYIGRESWVDSAVTSTTSAPTVYREGSTASVYDAWGHRETFTETTPLKDYDTTLISKRFFAYDANGAVILRRDGTIDDDGQWKQEGGGSQNSTENPAPDYITSEQWTAMSSDERKLWQGRAGNQHFVFSGGQQLAYVSEAGMLRVAGAEGGFDSSDLGTSMVTVNAGETLRDIAQSVYGNASYWYVIAQANAVSDSDLFAGQALKVPELKTSKNDASTFRPYNPAEAIGPTEPGTPHISPPKPAQCDALMMMMMIAVIVVACIATAGAAAMAMGVTGTAAGGTGVMSIGAAALSGGLGGATVASGAAIAAGTVGAAATTIGAGAAVGVAAAAGFAGGLAGSIAGQVVGKAVGLVDHFSLRQAVGSGIGTALTAGASQWAKIGEFGTLARGAASGAIGSGASYAGNRIAGVSDTHFSWRRIAADVVSAAATAEIAKGLHLESKAAPGVVTPGGFFNDVAVGAIGGVVSLHTRRAFGFTDKVNYWSIAADAFGNAIGNAFSRKFSHEESESDQSAAKSNLSQNDATTMPGVLDWWLDDGETYFDKNEWFSDDSSAKSGEDQQRRREMIAEEEDARRLGNSSPAAQASEFEGIYSGTRTASAPTKMPGGGYSQVYSGTFVDQRKIAGIGGSRWSWVLRTYPVIESAPATVTELPDLSGSGASGGAGRPLSGGMNPQGMAYAWLYNTIANWYNETSDANLSRFDKTSLGRAMKNSGYRQYMENHRFRIPTYEPGVSVVGAMKDRILPAFADMGYNGEVGSWGEFAEGFLLHKFNSIKTIANNSGFGELYEMATGSDFFEMTPIAARMKSGSAFSEATDVLLTIAAPAVLESRAANARFLSATATDSEMLGGRVAKSNSLGMQNAEYRGYRQQGFSKTQAEYLLEPYPEANMGHHFLARQYSVVRGGWVPDLVVENPLNIMGRGMTRGKFYERHFLGDPDFYGARFPRRIGGSWSGAKAGLVKPSAPFNLWYAAPDWMRYTGTGLVGGGAVWAGYECSSNE
jgi:hypothetical protein